ncbi:hypothetical protein JCM8547_005540 [Rhodosporidiobolus lusitaniae]
MARIVHGGARMKRTSRLDGDDSSSGTFQGWLPSYPSEHGFITGSLVGALSDPKKLHAMLSGPPDDSIVNLPAKVDFVKAPRTSGI